MPEKPVERVSKYNLTTAGTDQYANQSSQNPETARIIKGLIPSQAGYMERENPWPLFATGTNLPSKIVWLYEFDQNVAGAISRYFFAATATALYLYDGVSAWAQVTAVGVLAGPPIGVTINNLFHFSDGVASWLFDGTNWVVDGFAIPQHAPVLKVNVGAAPLTMSSIKRVNGVITATATTVFLTGLWYTIAGCSDTTFNGEFQATSVLADTVMFSQPGFPDNTSVVTPGTINPSSFTVTTNKYYWTTFSDQTTTHPHESSSSPRSLPSGAVTAGNVVVSQRPGTVSVGIGSPNIVGVGTDFDQFDVGMLLYSFTSLSTFGLIGVIQSVTDPQHLTLGVNSPVTLTGAFFAIAPARATHWNIYCSEAENSQIGFFLASVALIGRTDISADVGANYEDQSPFAGDPNSYIDTLIQRPVRNDPPTGTKIMSVHKRRIFRRNESLQDFFNFTAYEEVLAFGTGDPYECVPGHDPHTLSDLVDEDPYPDQSVQIRAMESYADVLFIGSDKNVYPLFGESIDDFVLSQITAFQMAAGSRYCMKGTAQGLIFLSSDKKLMLWPSQWIPFYAPEETSQLVELSRPLRPNFANILSSDLDNVQGVWYYYGKRNWFVVCFQDKTNTYHTWIFDFEIKGWFELHQGVSSIAVWEPSFGNKILVGGGTDGNVYVLDDQNGLYPTVGMNFPQGQYRLALSDMSQPDMLHKGKYIEYEVSNPALQVTVNYYLDPADVDNPGTPISVVMSATKLDPRRFRGHMTANNEGTTYNRILVEFIVASDQNSGVLRSVDFSSDPVSKLATS